jgi:hypothetical protein
VADGTPVISTIDGTVVDLKVLLGAAVITSCAVRCAARPRAELDRAFDT